MMDNCWNKTAWSVWLDRWEVDCLYWIDRRAGNWIKWIPLREWQIMKSSTSLAPVSICGNNFMVWVFSHVLLQLKCTQFWHHHNCWFSIFTMARCIRNGLQSTRPKEPRKNCCAEKVIGIDSNSFCLILAIWNRQSENINATSFPFVVCRVRVALTEDGVPMSTLREIALLKQLDAFKHPNIVK